MRKTGALLLIFSMLLSVRVFAQGSENCLRIMSWNIKDFGKTKDSLELAFISDVIRSYDIVTIQEVVAGKGGPEAVVRLVQQLNSRENDWDYLLSRPTNGNGKERYAFLWKKTRVEALYDSLLGPLDSLFEREPYFAVFLTGSFRLGLAGFHAVPKRKKPERENARLAQILDMFPDEHIIIAGDFNLSHTNSAFDSLRNRDMQAAIRTGKTSLKREGVPSSDGSHLSEFYDNLFYPEKALRPDSSGIIDFSFQFSDLKAAIAISDHLPVWGCFCPVSEP